MYVLKNKTSEYDCLAVRVTCKHDRFVGSPFYGKIAPYTMYTAERSSKMLYVEQYLEQNKKFPMRSGLRDQLRQKSPLNKSNHIFQTNHQNQFRTIKRLHGKPRVDRQRAGSRMKIQKQIKINKEKNKHRNIFHHSPRAAPMPAEAANKKSSAIFQSSLVSAVKSLYKS